MNYFKIITHSMMLLVSSLLISPIAMANTNFEMCQAGIKSPVSHQATPIKFVLDKSFNGPVSIYWIDFNGHLKFYKHLNPGEQYGLQTYVGHEWVVIPGNNKQNGCAYYAAQRNSTIKITDHNAPNPDGSFTYSGTWQWAPHSGTGHDKHNNSVITFWSNSKVHYCYNSKCVDAIAKEHGEYSSFTALWGYYEFVVDHKRNVLIGSYWPFNKKNEFPHASITMHPGAP